MLRTPHHFSTKLSFTPRLCGVHHPQPHQRYPLSALGNYLTWLSRGWCRAELWCRLLSNREDTSVVVVFSVGFLAGVAGWPRWVSQIESCLKVHVCESTSGYLRSRKIPLEQSNRAGLKICYLQIILGFFSFLFGRLLEGEEFLVSYDNAFKITCMFPATLALVFHCMLSFFKWIDFH